MEDRYCIVCGNPISRFHSDGRKIGHYERRKCCSRDCSIILHKRLLTKSPVKKKCEICGELFITKNQDKKTCSKKCADISSVRNRLNKQSMKTCPICGKTITKAHNYYQRIYCSSKCGCEARKERGRLNKEQIDYLIENFNFRGVGYCAKYFNLAKKTLQDKIRKYQKENGPIPYKSKEPPPEKKPVDVKREYSEAWIECKWILDRWHNQIIKGRTDLMTADRLIRSKIDDIDRETLYQIFEEFKDISGVASSVLEGRYEKVS